MGDSDLNTLIPEKIRLITFDENTIKVLLKGDSEIVFQFRTRDEMAKALEAWTTKRDVADALASPATLQFPSDSKCGEIYPK